MRGAFGAVAAGSAAAGTPVQLGATAARPSTGTPALASVLPEVSPVAGTAANRQRGGGSGGAERRRTSPARCLVQAERDFSEAMKYRFFHVSALYPQAGESELNEFCASHRVGSVEKSLIMDGAHSYWTFCVGYLDGTEKLPVGRKGRIDYREVLNEADFAVFARLRGLRKELAEREGVPAYALFTNEQLAEMVTGRISSLSDLQAIDGIGEAKTKKYGEAFLAELKKGFTEFDGNTAHASDPD